MPFGRNQQLIGEILTQAGRLSIPQLRRSLKMQSDLGKSRTSRPKLGELLVRCNLIEEAELAKALATQYECQFLEPDPQNVRPGLFNDIPLALLRSYRFVPLGRDHESISIAVADFDESDLPDMLRKATRLGIKVCVTTESRMEELRRTYLAVIETAPAPGGGSFEEKRETAPHVEEPLMSPQAEDPSDLEITSSGTTQSIAPRDPVALADTPSDSGEPIDVPFPCAIEGPLYRLLQLAVRKRYLNISFSPTGSPVQVLAHRAGGQTDLIRTGPEIRRRIRAALAGITGLDEGALRTPARKKLRWIHEQGTALFEVILFPAACPQLVINLLKTDEATWSFEDAGLSGDAFNLVKRYVTGPAGVIALAGRTPQSAWRLWVAMLADHVGRGRKVMSVESKLSHAIPGIVQHALDSSADGGRRSLSQVAVDTLVGRQCDVLALRTEELPPQIGEMINVSRGRTRLVLGMSAPSALGALRGIERATGKTLTDGLFIFSCRVPRLCPLCRESYKIMPGTLPPEQDSVSGETVYRSNGCSACHHGGQFGPAHFYEVLRLDGELMKRDGIDFYSRSLKDHLLERGLLVLAGPAARQALLAGDIGLDDYLAITSRQ